MLDTELVANCIDCSEANLSALTIHHPQAARQIRSASIPKTAALCEARDGSITYSWLEGTELRWLGRATMPRVRAQALVDAFQPGNGNVLFCGLGQGTEARKLLDRMQPHQALFALEDSPATASLALRLYDFEADIRRGRLHFFVGDTAWRDLEDYLRSHDGYVVPQRIMSWPWFDDVAVGGLSERLSQISIHVAGHRAAKMAQHGPFFTQTRSDNIATPSIVIAAGSPEPDRIREAQFIELAATELGWKSCNLVSNSPEMQHPCAIEAATVRHRPTHTMLLASQPAGLSFRVPIDGQFLLWTLRAAPPDNWLAALPSGIRLGVTTESIRKHILAQRPDIVVEIVRPAAQSGLAPSPDRSGENILVVADWIDPTPKSAGLNLASHQRIWTAATEILLERCDEYIDAHAPDVLAEALQRCNMRLEHEEVAAGLVERFRTILGPSVVRKACVESLVRANIDIRLIGHGWSDVSDYASKCIAAQLPDPRGMPALLSEAGLVITLDTTGDVQQIMLDALCAGVPVAVRSHPLDETEDGLSGLLDECHVARFGSRNELATIIRRFQDDPAPMRESARAAADHIRTRHTWVHRLRQIFDIR